MNIITVTNNVVSIALISLIIGFYLVDGIYSQEDDGNEDQLLTASIEDLVNKANLLMTMMFK
jgi:hypothetical protein